MKQFKSPLPELTIKYKSGEQKRIKIAKSADAYDLLMHLFNADTIEYSEEMIIIYTNRANNTIGWMRVSTGGMAGTVCDSRMVFAVALKCAAHGLIIAHNHPSGRLSPSDADIRLTRDLVAAGKLLDIRVHDHMIVTPDGYYSMCDSGTVQF